MDALEIEAVRLTSLLLTGENWAKLYGKTPDQHADLINGEATLQVVLTRFFNSLSKQAGNLINADHYNYQLSQNKTTTLDKIALAYNVDVIVNDDVLDQADRDFINITLKTANNIISAGAQASQSNYGRYASHIQSTDAIIQELTTRQVAALVGKRVQKDGSIVDNPNPKYNVMETVRNDIAQSVKTSLATGEDIQAATKRMQNIISNPVRAAIIARTEAVNAYNTGVSEYGRQTGAVGMEWMDAGATDECADYANRGPIAIDEDWDGLDGPPAHPNCRCAKRLIYQDEWDSLSR